jgi:hypothetical protein
MYDDPIVNDVRKTRERLAEKYDFDVSAIFKDLRKRQGMLGKKLVRRARKGFAEQGGAGTLSPPALAKKRTL